MSTFEKEREEWKVLWYAMCAYRREKKAKASLEDAGIEHFVPMCYKMHDVRGKRQRTLVPAVPSLVFVRSNKLTINDFKIKNPYLKYVMRTRDGINDYIVVPDDQMQSFIDIARHFEEDLTYFRPDEIELKKGIRVRVCGGVFDGVEGTLLKVNGKRNKRIVVEIDGVAAIASAEISPEFIQVISD